MYTFNGEPRQGVHLKFDDNGIIKRVLRTDDETIQLEDTTISGEIIRFANSDHTDFLLSLIFLEAVVDKYENLKDDESKVDTENRLFQGIDILLENIERFDPSLSYLMKSTVDDTWHFYYDLPTIDRINNCLIRFEQYLFVHTELQFLLNDLIDGNELDFEDRCQTFKYSEIITTYTHTDKGLEEEYYCHLFLEYCVLLVNKFLEMNYNVQRCKCCGDYFVAKTKKKTLYCDRVLANGNTCKQYGPKLNRIAKAEQDEVIYAYDKAVNKMYRRMKRTEEFGVTEKSIISNEYYEWLSKAKEAKQKYLNGAITSDETLAIINSD